MIFFSVPMIICICVSVCAWLVVCIVCACYGYLWGSVHVCRCMAVFLFLCWWFVGWELYRFFGIWLFGLLDLMEGVRCVDVLLFMCI